ncbi:MAG: amidohydrolase family protein [Gemmatimonadaceae bacterium]
MRAAPSPVPRALAEVIDSTAWIDTHEHLVEERHRLAHADDPYIFKDWPEPKGIIPADWTALIANYAIDDLVCAGLPSSVVENLLLADEEPLAKWTTVAPYFEAARTTGYLRAVDVTTDRLFGLRLSDATCVDIDTQLRSLRRANYYSYVLREIANVERCQVNSVETLPYCRSKTPDLLEQDLSILPLSLGEIHTMEGVSGIEIKSLDDYLATIDWCFEEYGDLAVAVKCQWGYTRSLEVEIPSKPPREAFINLRQGAASELERREVQDYLLGYCLKHAVAWQLPAKFHLGYLAGYSRAPLVWAFDHVKQIMPLIHAFPDLQFVLMHMAWPQQEQLLALAKHHHNVIVDLCWAWIISPIATADFVRRFISTVPATKLLCFGGDYTTVENVVGHAELARRGLQTALESLVLENWLSLDRAVELAPQLMRGNAERVFPARSGRKDPAADIGSAHPPVGP